MKRWPARHAPALSGGVQAILRALGYQPSLEMRDCGEHMEHQFAGRRSGVDIFFKADEINLLFFQRVDGLQKFPERTPEAVKPCYAARESPGRA